MTGTRMGGPESERRARAPRRRAPAQGSTTIEAVYYVVRAGAPGSPGQRPYYSERVDQGLWSDLLLDAHPFPTLEAAHRVLTRLRGAYEVRCVCIASEALD